MPPRRGQLAAGAGDIGPMSEDCLTLNIWAPDTRSSARRPVMVWIHGGALVFREAIRDLVFTAYARRIAYLHSQQAPTWRYYFSHVQTGLRPRPPGVGHGGEIAFVMGTGDSCRCLPAPFSSADRALSREVGDYWLGFARNGAPAAAGAPAWPKDTTRRAQFSATPTVRPNFMQARLNVLIGALKGIGGYLGKKGIAAQTR